MGPSLLRSLYCALLVLFPALAWAQAPNLEVTITPSGATTVIAGNQITYTVTVRNIAGGGGNANTNRSRTVTGRLTFAGVVPTTVTVTPVAPLGGTGNYATGVASMALGTLLNSTQSPNQQQFTVVATVPSTTPAGTVMTVSGSAASTNTTDAANEVNANNNNGTNAAAINTVTVQTSADVTSNITGPTTASAGSTITYTVTSTNAGPSTAAGVVPTLTLAPAQPLANLTLPSGASYNPGTGVVTFATSSIASGGNVTNAVQIVLGAGATLSGQAKNTATTTDPDAADNDGSAAAANVTTVVTAQANVATTVAGPTTGTGGQTVTYTVTSTNNGPSAASNSVATLTLTAPQPSGSVTVTNGTYNPTTGVVTWNASNLTNGQTATYTVNVVLPNSGTLAVRARSTASTTDNTASNNDGTAAAANVTTTITTLADLATTLSGPTTAAAGSTFVYTATTTNNGPSTASNVIIRIQFPANFPAGSLSYTGGTYIQGTGVLTFNTVTSQATGAGNALVRTVTVTAPASGTVTGRASSTTTATDGTPANNDGTATNANVTTTISATANLATTLSPTTATANSGQNVTLTATTNNGGPSTATGVVVTIQLTPFLPAGSVTVTNGTYNPANGLVTFNSTSITSGSNQTNTVVFVAPATGTVTGQAASTSAAADGTPANNDGSAANANSTITINTADIQATVVQNNATISAGSSVTYTSTIRNNGGGTATGIVPTLTLSVGGTPPALASLTLPGGASYNPTTGVVTFATLASLNNGATQTYAVTFASSNTTPAGTLATAQVAATSATTDLNATNNNGSATAANVTTTINAAGDVITTLAQSITGAVAPGGTVTYTLTVRNNAGNTASTLVPTLTLSLAGSPPALADLTLPGGATYNATTGAVTFATIATLTNGSQQQFAVTITVPAGTASGVNLTGQGASTAASSDTNPPNNNGSQANANVTTPILAAGADVIATISGPTSAPSGSIVYYTVTVANSNLSSTAATNVVPTIQLPIGLLGVSFSRQGTYDPATGIGTWPTIGTLNANNSTSYNVSFALPDAGATGIASATASSFDPVATNNNGSLPAANLTTTPTQVADVTVSVSGPTVIAPNERITYLVSVGNEGPSTATGITPTLTLPTGLVGVVLPNGGSYSSTTGIVTFPTTATLVKGGSLAYLVRLPGLAAGSLSGVAAGTATTANGDPVVANNNGSLPPANITTTVNALVAQLQCASPGQDGSITTTATSILNTYFPGTLTAAANSTAIVMGAAQIGTTPIAAGDLLLVMQMQGAAIDFSNSNSYGDGILSGRASGNLTSTFTAGQYEYVIAASSVPLTGGTLTLSGPLVFTYTDADATTTNGQQRYQIIRIPQYLNLTLGADLTMPAWNGRVGGVLPLDVANRIAMGTFKINGKGKGFRGGAGIQLGGSGTAGLTNQDYRTSNANTTNASKGEGIAGTPRYINNGGALVDTRTAGLLPAALTDGYPDGDFGRGAPGNAGGGGTDGSTGSNSENSGGGGGSNAGFGGTGGNTWNSNLQVGGFGGADFTAASPARLIMGGGGGAGSTNNGTTVAGGPGAGFASSGAAGGGIVIARATSVTGTGTIDVSGDDMTYVPLNDASGGGGAGGSVLFLSNSALTTVTVLARGGAGGSNTGGDSPHGPGGSGAGGVAYTSSPISATSNLSSGANGTTFGTIAYGSGTGTAASGQALFTVTQADAPNVISATSCTADVATSITGPTIASTNEAVTYTITVRNLGPSNATGVESFITLAPNLPAGSVTLPVGATYDPVTGIVTFPLIPTLAPGIFVTRSITYTFPFRQDVTGTSTATAIQLDLLPGNNDGTAPNANVLTRYNRPPVVQDVTNTAPISSNAAATAVLPLSGSDPEGSAITFTIQALPPASQGIFLVNGVVLNTTNFPGLVLTEAQAAQLQFDPNGAYSGPVTFTYKATDALNLDSDAPLAVYSLQVGASVDLVTTVSGPTTAAAGSTVTYTVSTVNSGSGVANTVVPTITIAPALPLASLTLPSGASYNPTTGVVTFATTATLNSGATLTNTVSYVAPAAGGTITGQAASTTTTFDTNTANNDGSAVAANITTVISLSTDLVTTISGPTTAAAGSTVTYTATTLNNGPSTATGVAPTITIAPALPLASLTLPSGASYNPTTGVVTFATTGTLNSGTSVTNSVSYIAPASGPVTGQAANTSTTTDPTAANNNGTAANANVSTAITPIADVTTAFTVSPTVVNPSTATSTYTVTYTNNGPSQAAGVTRTVTLPVGSTMTAGQVTASGGSYNSTSRVLTFPVLTTLNAGATSTATFAFTASATSGNVSVLSNVGTSTSQGVDAAPNSATVPLRVNARPTANAVTNVTLPNTSGATVLNANLSGSDPDGTISSFLIATLPAAGTLAYNGVTLTTGNIGSTVIPNTPAGLALLTFTPLSGSTTTATFTYTATDNNGLASTAATYSIPLSAVANVATTITPSVSPVNAGSSLVLTIGFVNNGPNTASTVTRQVTLPAGLGAANVIVTNGGTYDNTTGIVTYGNTGTLNSGANLSSTITITRVPLTASIAVTSATSTTTNENGATANNTAALTVPVTSTAPSGCGISYSGSGSSSGLFTQYYLGYFEDTPNYQTAFFGNAAQLSRTEPTVNFPANNSWGDLVTSGAATGSVADPNTYSARFRGSIYIPTTGTYTFYTTSDDASAMYIDGAALAPTPGTTGNALVKNFGRHGSTQASASVTLTAGLHNVLLYFGEDAGGNLFTWEWENVAAGISRQIVPNSALCAGGAGPDLVTVISGPAAVSNNQSFTYTVTTTNPATLSTAAATNVVQTIQLAPNLPATAVTVTNGTYNALTGLVTFNPTATLALGGSIINTVTMNVGGLGVLTVTGQAASTASTTDSDVTSNNGSQAAANVTTRISTGITPPVAQNVTNAPSMSYTAAATAILPLVATDADGVVSSYTVLTLPTAGQGLLYVNGVELNVTNFPGLVLTPTQATQLSFDPARSQYGNITFTYRATDNDNLSSNTAIYTIPVTNQAPTANADQNDVPLNTTTSGNVRLNDTDPDGDPLTVSTTLVVAPAHGTVVMQPNGQYTYTPATGYLGPDQFSYSVCDGASPPLCATGIVNVRVYNPATACASGTGLNLLANSDFNSGTVPGTGANGFGFTTQYNYVAPGGSLVPENTYAITADPLAYHPSFSGGGRGGAGDRFLAINASPDIQVQYSQTVVVQPNRYYTFSAYFQNLLVAGGATPVIGFVINGQSTSGTVTIPPRGSAPSNWIRFSDIWYSGANTTAVFEIRNLTTDRGGNDLGIDDVYFGTCNLPPVANADLQNTPPATPITFSITANDNDGDGVIVPGTAILTGSAPGTPRSFTDASGNTFVVDALGNLTFTPAVGFVGTATTTYTVQDNNNATSNPALIAVTVQAPATDVQTAITSPTNGSTIIAGQPQTITVQTTNNGPNAAYNVVQTVDVRPSLGVTDVFVNGQAGMLSGSVITFPGGATYNVTTGIVTFPALASQAVSGSASNTVTFPAPGSGPLAVTANVTHAALDGVPANNTSTVSLTVSPRFDLLTTISGPTSAMAGNQVTFSVVTANNAISASAGQSVVQTVQLPANLAQVFVTNGGTYNAANGVVTFPTVNNLAPGQQQVNTISFDAPATGFTATARVTPNTTGAGDINTVNNSASAAAITITPAGTEQTNPFVTIDASAYYVAPGTPVDILIGTGNLGPDGALGVQVSVQMNPGLTFTNLGGGTYDAATGMLTFAALNRPNGPMPAGDRYSYTATLLAPMSGPVLAAAVVNSTTHDVVSGNNFMSTRIDVFPRVDLSISLAAPTAVNAGDPLVYVVTTTNLSGLPARNLDQTVQLAPNLTGVTVTGGGTYSSTTGLVTLPVITNLAVGASQSYAIALTAPADITTLRAVANVASETTESLYTNNIATATTTLSPAADVTITISGPATGVINSPVTYVVTTLNNGPSVAGSTTPIVQLPRNLVLVNLPAGATYTAATGVLTLPTLANLPAGASSATAFTVVMPDVARLVPTANATVTAATNDRNLTNNFAITTTLASAPTDAIADLSATVTVASGGTPVTTATPAQSLTYTAVFTNNGAGAANGTAPRLALPSGLTAASLTISNGGTYDAASGLVTWPVLTTALDINQAVTYTVTLPAPITGPLVATAIVSSATSDNVPANNTQSTSVTISPRADVISRVAGPANAQPGEPVTYSVTTLNNGPSSAAAVQTTVTLPAGATNVVLPAGATQAGNVVTLPLDAFQTSGTNGQQTYLITFTPAPASTSWTVTSNVITTTTETNGGNNGGTATTTRSNVRPVATNIVNDLVEPIGNTATGPRAISSLVGADADGTILRYTLVALPPSSQGVLYVNGVELNTTNFPGLVLTPTQATQLQFDPASGFTGNVFFQYTTTDNATAVSLPALYTIPVGRDLDSYYTTLPVGGGPNPYQANQPIANLFDANGGEYTGANVADTGTRTVTLVPASTLPLGVGLNATTGQFFVTDPALLVPGTYVMQVQSVDEFSGTNLATVTLQIGVNPLPVELVRFNAQPRRTDAVLDWLTAQERNNAFFGIERSLDGGRTFTEIGRVIGAGTTSAAHEYGYVDAGIGRTPGTVYYRLRQVDQDGTFTYSDVRAVRFTGDSAPLTFAVWPNPATTTATVRLTGNTTGSVLTVIDAVGRVVQRHELDATTTERPLDVTTLPVGTYLIRLTTLDGQSATQRLVRE